MVAIIILNIVAKLEKIALLFGILMNNIILLMIKGATVLKWIILCGSIALVEESTIAD